MSVLALPRLPRFGRFRLPEIDGVWTRLLAARQCGRAARRGRRPDPVALRILGIDERAVVHVCRR